MKWQQSSAAGAQQPSPGRESWVREWKRGEPRSRGPWNAPLLRVLGWSSRGPWNAPLLRVLGWSSRGPWNAPFVARSGVEEGRHIAALCNRSETSQKMIRDHPHQIRAQGGSCD